MLFFFFFKQKTAYEIGVRLVGSEMCIRDSCGAPPYPQPGGELDEKGHPSQAVLEGILRFLYQTAVTGEVAMTGEEERRSIAVHTGSFQQVARSSG